MVFQDSLGDEEHGCLSDQQSPRQSRGSFDPQLPSTSLIRLHNPGLYGKLCCLFFVFVQVSGVRFDY